jgi:FkbM family methyltransferase
MKKDIEGFPMFLSDTLTGLSAHLWGDGYHEPGFMWILRKEADGELALDIGANIGYSTLSLCKKMKKVIAIEPDDRSRRILKKNIALNDFKKKVKIYNFAISNKSGERVFYLSKHPNLSAFNKNRKYWTKKKMIKTRTVDSLNINPNFIKMDLEGHETEVIEGAEKSLIRTKKCKILLEVHPQFYNEKNNFSKVLRDLVKIGFKIKYLISAGESCPSEIKRKNYIPFKEVKAAGFIRGIYKNMDIEDAIIFATKYYPCLSSDGNHNKANKKVARSIMLEK